MLDLRTAIVFLMAMMVMDGIIAIIIWASHRRFKGLGMICCGLLAFGAAVWLVPSAVLPLVVLRNTLFNLSHALASEGMAKMLNQRSYTIIPIVAFSFTLVFWPLALTHIPDPPSDQIRVAVSSLIAIIIEARMAYVLLRDKILSFLLRWATLLSISAIILTVVFRMINAATTDWTAKNFLSQEQAWFYFYICIEINFLFFCLLVMFGERLKRDYEEQNRALIAEISLRQRIQGELEQALEVQARMDAERRTFLEILGHEINTPLTIIDRSAEMIMAAPNKIASRINNIRESARRLSSLINDLLAAERSFFAPSCEQVVDLENLIGSIIELLQDNKTRVRFSGLADGEVITCTSDPGLLEIALHNIIGNAIKYSKNSGLVSIETLSCAGEAIVRVRDNGIGFPAGESGDATKIFFRGSNTKQIPGKGLGLYIASKIIHNLGGRIEIGNHSQGGAEVVVHIPRRD